MAKLLFTSKALDALISQTKPTEYWDAHTTGLGLRISALGIKSWTFLYRYRRRLRRLGFGRYPTVTLAEARVKAQQAIGDIAHGIDPAATRDAERVAGTFEELTTDYVEKYAKRRKRRWHEDKRTIDNLFPRTWRHRKVSEVTRRDIRSYLEELVARGIGVTANRHLTLLKVIFRFAVENDWIEQNPCLGMRPLVTETHRDRFLNDEELQSVLPALLVKHTTESDALYVQLLTAQRIGEVTTMAWADVDLPNRRWTIPSKRSKNGRQHLVPLSEQCASLLAKRRLVATGALVFPAARTDGFIRLNRIQAFVTRLTKRVGVSFRSHDLRRTAASHMSSLGVQRLVIAKILNHSDGTVTAIYDRHSYETEKRHALQQWANRLDTIALPPQVSNVTPFASNA